MKCSRFYQRTYSVRHSHSVWTSCPLSHLHLHRPIAQRSVPVMFESTNTSQSPSVLSSDSGHERFEPDSSTRSSPADHCWQKECYKRASRYAHLNNREREKICGNSLVKHRSYREYRYQEVESSSLPSLCSHLDRSRS